MSNKTYKFENDGNKAVPTIFVLVFIVIVLIVAYSIANPTFNTPQQNTPEVQFKSDIYQHFTVYSDNIGGAIFVIEIDVDDSISVGCDGWLGDDENGHNCVLVGSDSISELLTQQNLTSVYPNIKGE